ncbi:maleylacetoacetate isomerase [Pilaira anomala]|nr:maleylacetoacetate isomerase [Pilaira anomala]
MKPVLYSYFRSSASWRVRIALAWKKIDYDLKPIDLTKKEQKSEEYHKLVPTQKVPAFVTEDGKIISQSQAIIEYIEEAYPERPMLPKSLYQKAEVREICQIIACDIHPVQNLGVLMRVSPDDEQKRKDWARTTIELGFNGLETRLEASAGTYCVANTITMADFFLVSIVGNAKRYEVDMSNYPIITRINNTLSTLPEFQAADPFHQPDCPEDLRK